jgi:putative DNA primase/helicase
MENTDEDGPTEEGRIMDSFLERALPLVKRGLSVFPIASAVKGDGTSGKNPLTENGVDDATTNRLILIEWNRQWPTANVGCAANGVGFLDDDRGDLKECYESETGKLFPPAFTVRTSICEATGLQKKHYYYGSDETTILLGNRKAAIGDEERFSFREHGYYVVGPGSVHWTGTVYAAEDMKAPFGKMDKEFALWLEKNSSGPKAIRSKGLGPTAHENWKPGEWLTFYEDIFTCQQDGDWWVSSICPATYEGPGTGRKHEHSQKTGFRFDGRTPEFHCFAGGCIGSMMTFGQLVKHLNQYHEPYPGKIWVEESIDKILEAFDVMPAESLETEAVPEQPIEPGGKHWRNQADTGGFTTIRLDEVKERPVDWLWKGRLPRGCGLVVSGAVGTNKSMFGTDIAARMSRGRDWPDGQKNTMGMRETLIAATEDDLETTIKPRLMAADADCSKIHFLKNAFDKDDSGNYRSRELNITEDIYRLREYLQANPQILLVILDPLTGFFGGIDGNDNKRIRPMMQAIAKVCRMTGVAFILLIHENKRGDANAVDKILGAGSVSQVVRAGIRISKDPKAKPDGRIMANIKSSLSREPGGMRFSIGSKDVEAYDGRMLEEIGYIEWGEKHDLSADDVMDEERAAKKEGGFDSKLEAAKAFLRIRFSQNWEYKCDKLYAEAESPANGSISVDTLKRARKKLITDKEMDIEFDDRRRMADGGWEMGGWWWVCRDTKARLAGEEACKLIEAI